MAALLKETRLQQNYLGNEPVETIYIGGGTPSLLSGDELQSIIEKVKSVFIVLPDAELTLEANPDDINEETLLNWLKAGINRLSIGIQSFFEEDLQWMNRAHTAAQASANLELALRYFKNITVDLIYGTPQLTNEKWNQNVNRVIDSGVPHLSCYALTVEPKTPLDKMISEKKMEDVNPDKQAGQFLLLIQWLEDAGYEQYEISNFAKPGWQSRHNSAYWQQKKYLGLGPSAHSFDGSNRQWNIANNQQYIESIKKGEPLFEKEILTDIQKTNEYIMTSLRTSEGLDLSRLEHSKKTKLITTAKKYLDSNLMEKKENFLQLTREGKLLADGIAAKLFF